MRVHRKSAGGGGVLDEGRGRENVPGKFRPGLKREERREDDRETDKIVAGV